MSDQRLSIKDRGTLRKAISRHADWKQYRHGNSVRDKHSENWRAMNTGDIKSGKQAVQICEELGIDWREVLRIGDKQALFDKAKPEAPHARNDDDTARVLGDLEGLLNSRRGMSEHEIRSIVKEEVSLAYEPEVITEYIYQPSNGSPVKLDGIVHPTFIDLLAICGEKPRPNIMLVGPAGSGKSFAAEAVSEVLGVPFHFQSMALESFDLIGHVALNNEYQETAFVRGFRDGGVFLADEFDRWLQSASVVLNAALANDRMYLPDGSVIKRHPDFICIAAVNTWGQGPTAEYPEAQRMEISTLSRFPQKLSWDYDVDFEMKLAGDNADNQAWVREIQAVRVAAEVAGLQVNADPRTMKAGFTSIPNRGIEATRKSTYLAGLDSDQSAALTIAVKTALEA